MGGNEIKLGYVDYAENAKRHWERHRFILGRPQQLGAAHGIHPREERNRFENLLVDAALRRHRDVLREHRSHLRRRRERNRDGDRLGGRIKFPSGIGVLQRGLDIVDAI